MTITLKPETERAIEEAARRRGVTPDAVVEETMARELMPILHEPDADAAERERRRQGAWSLIKSGYFARLLGSSDEFMARKAEEKALEDRHIAP